MSFTPFPVDPDSGAVVVIQAHEVEIHEGDMYFYTDSVTLNSAAVQNYLLTTPNTLDWAHMVFSVDGTAVTTFQLYESADRTGTTLQTSFNNNRNSIKTSTMTIHKGTSGGTTDGTLIKTYSSGTSQGSSKTPSTEGFGDQIILKQNTKYILRITSGTAGNLCNVHINWFQRVI
jgi:hypothetical protein